MKQINDLSKAEVLALTDEQINTMIDLECACENVPLLPPEPVKPDVPKFEPDTTYYGIVGFYFKAAEDAAKILNAFDSVALLRMGYSDKFPIPPSDYEKPKIEPKKFMSPEMYDRVKGEKAAADSAMEKYTSDKKDYDEIVKQRVKQVDYVWDIVNEVRQEQYKKDSFKSQFKRYLTLADGNHAIAWKFLVNANYEAEKLEGLYDELVPAQYQDPVEGPTA